MESVDGVAADEEDAAVAGGGGGAGSAGVPALQWPGARVVGRVSFPAVCDAAAARGGLSDAGSIEVRAVWSSGADPGRWPGAEGVRACGVPGPVRAASMSAAKTWAVSRAATRASRERSARSVKPGWWVFSHGPADLGCWGQVTAVTHTSTGGGRVRMTLTDHGTGRVHEVDARPTDRAWCCTAAEARRAGLDT
jgi:hypothetical protein